jgi:DNA polymerase III gamma/tau subunit
LATEQLVRLLECLQAGEQGIRQGLSPRANFEVTLLKAIEQSRSRSIDSLIKDIAAAAAGLPREPGQKKINPSPSTPAVEVVAPRVVEPMPGPVAEPVILVAQPVSAAVSRVDEAEELPIPQLSEEEAIIAENREAESFNFVLKALPAVTVAEVGKASFPGEEDFDHAVASLPPGLAEKLRITLGAEFTALRPIPAGKLRKPL